VVLLDEEDVQPDEPVDCGLLEKWYASAQNCVGCVICPELRF
jgi:hypothetical protein